MSGHALSFAALLLIFVVRQVRADTKPILSLSGFDQGSPTPPDCPDPSMIQFGGNWYAFCTNAGGKSIPFIKSNSQDLLHAGFQSELFEALPNIGDDINAEKIWAPDISKLADSTYVIFFSAVPKGAQKHCIFSATSNSPTSAFSRTSFKLCDDSAGGAIDSALCQEDGKKYLVYKVDGNSLNRPNQAFHPTPIKMQKLTDDAAAVDPSFKDVTLIDRDDLDGPLVEAPYLVKDGPNYILTFSSNYYNTDKYDVSYARSTVLTGPYEKVHAPYAPLLVTNTLQGLVGPGGGSLYKVGNEYNLIFHAGPVGSRRLYVAGVTLGSVPTKRQKRRQNTID